MIHMENIMEYKIEVLLNNNCAWCDEYHYTVFAYDNHSPHNGWYSTGISGSTSTPEKAFKQGYAEYKRNVLL